MSDTAPRTIQDLATRDGPSFPGVYATAPLWRCPRTGIWVAESYALVKDALGRPEDFSSKVSLSMLDPEFPGREVEAIYRDGGCVWTRTLQANDPPDHRRFRALVERVFPPSKVDALVPFMDSAADELLAVWPDREVFDAVDGYAMPLPLRVISSQLGVPSADFRLFKRWSDAAVRAIGLGASREQHLEAAHAGVEFQRYFTSILCDATCRPAGSLVDRIATAAASPEAPLSLPEQLSLLHTLMIAGHETTTATLASLLLSLAMRPGTLAAVRADAVQSKRLIEDVLRLHAPVQGLFRVVSRDAELGGQSFTRGALLSLRLGAANRDPARFAEASLLSDTTHSAGHLSFGAGLHHCIGAPLARRELQVALEALSRRFASIQLPVPAASLEYSQNIMTRGLVALPLSGVPHAP